MVEQVVMSDGVVIVVKVRMIECTLCLWSVVIAVVEDIVVVREVVNVVEQVDIQLSEVCLNLQLHPVYLDTELQVV